MGVPTGSPWAGSGAARQMERREPGHQTLGRRVVGDLDQPPHTLCSVPSPALTSPLSSPGPVVAPRPAPLQCPLAWSHEEPWGAPELLADLGWRHALPVLLGVLGRAGSRSPASPPCRPPQFSFLVAARFVRCFSQKCSLHLQCLPFPPQHKRELTTHTLVTCWVLGQILSRYPCVSGMFSLKCSTVRKSGHSPVTYTSEPVGAEIASGHPAPSPTCERNVRFTAGLLVLFPGCAPGAHCGMHAHLCPPPRTLLGHPVLSLAALPFPRLASVTGQPEATPAQPVLAAPCSLPLLEPRSWHVWLCPG